MKDVEFLQFIVENIVSNKEAITIERTEDELGILLTLKVDSEDMWVVIGKAWATINGIRNLLRIIWMKNEQRVNLKVLD